MGSPSWLFITAPSPSFPPSSQGGSLSGWNSTSNPQDPLFPAQIGTKQWLSSRQGHPWTFQCVADTFPIPPVICLLELFYFPKWDQQIPQSHLRGASNMQPQLGTQLWGRAGDWGEEENPSKEETPATTFLPFVSPRTNWGDSASSDHHRLGGEEKVPQREPLFTISLSCPQMTN